MNNKKTIRFANYPCGKGVNIERDMILDYSAMEYGTLIKVKNIRLDGTESAVYYEVLDSYDLVKRRVGDL